MSQFVLYVLYLSLILTILGTAIIVSQYRSYYAGIGLFIVISYLLFTAYVSLEILIHYENDADQALTISKLSVAILGVALFLLHYFHDEISAEYRQRKTMTLGSVLLGIVLGTIFIDGSIEINLEQGAAVLHPLYGLAIVAQSMLLVHRISLHNMNMGRLSEHYGLKTSFTIEARTRLQYILYFMIGAAFLGFILFDEIISTPFTLIISLALFLLSYLYKQDSLSSLPVSQQLDGIAIIIDGKVKFFHQFSKVGFQIGSQQDFGIFMTSIGDFFVEIMQSEQAEEATSGLESISTQDMEVIFQELDDGYLVLISEDTTPLIKRILRQTAEYLNRTPPNTREEFQEIVTKQLIRMEY